MLAKKESPIVIHVEMHPVRESLSAPKVNFQCSFNEKTALSFLSFCSELRSRNVIRDYAGYEIFGVRNKMDKKENIMNHLYRIKKIAAARSADEAGQKYDQDGLFNLLFHLILGWHRQLEDLKRWEPLSIEEVVLKLQKDTQYYEALTTKPVRDADPRDYIIKRSGWILPGHFGAKSGG